MRVVTDLLILLVWVGKVLLNHEQFATVVDENRVHSSVAFSTGSCGEGREGGEEGGGEGGRGGGEGGRGGGEEGGGRGDDPLSTLTILQGSSQELRKGVPQEIRHQRSDSILYNIYNVHVPYNHIKGTKINKQRVGGWRQLLAART